MNINNIDSSKVKKTIQDRLEHELKVQKETLVVKQEEMLQLRDELFANLAEPAEAATKRKVVGTAMATTEEDLILRIQSMQALEESIENMTQDIQEIMTKRLAAEERLSNKRGNLNIELKTFIELEILINEINDDIQEIYLNFQSRIEEKQEERLRILNDPNLTEEERAELLEKINTDIGQLQEECMNIMSELALKQDEWTKNSKMYAEQLENSLRDLKSKYEQELEELEKLKLTATPSELIAIEAQMQELTDKYNENVALIETALTRKQYFTDEFGRYFLNEDGLKVYQRHSNASQYIRGPDGEMLKIEEAKTADDAQSRGVGGFTDSELSITTLELKRKEDQEYIKRELGTPLRLALAKITVLQPTDPINYLANFLLEYRYNQVMNAKKENDLQALLAERAKLKEEVRKHKLKQQQKLLSPAQKKEQQVFPHCTTCDDILGDP